MRSPRRIHPSTSRLGISRRGSLVVALVLVLSATLAVDLLAAPPANAADIDTFHLRLLQDGAELASAGRNGEAVQKLRLACFGMLDHPKVLGPCLGRLLATQELADEPEDEIEATVDRLLEVEKRFKGWSEPEARFAPSDDLRRRVDALFVRFGTVESLTRVPGLGDAALDKQVERVAALSPDERRKELNLLVQRQAGTPIWHVMSAELALEEGDPRAASGAAGEILRKFEGNAAARCVLGRARAEQGLCRAETVEHLRMCPAGHPRRLDVDLALLTCLVETERWSEADAAWDLLPVSAREERAVRRLRKQIDKNLDKKLDSGDAAGAASVSSSVAATVLGGGAGGETPKTARRAPVYAPPPGIAEEPPQRAGQPDGELPDGDLKDDKLKNDDLETLRRVRDALALEQRHLYAELWVPVRKAAKKRDDSAAAQRLAGSLAFRLSRWRDAVRFLRRDESLASSRPRLQLELAVALHYQGKYEEARREFAECRDLLAPSAWVEYWAAEIGT